MCSCFGEPDSKLDPLLEHEVSPGAPPTRATDAAKTMERPSSRGVNSGGSCKSTGVTHTQAAALGVDFLSPLRQIHNLLGTPGSWGRNTHSRGLGAVASPAYEYTFTSPSDMGAMG